MSTPGHRRLVGTERPLTADERGVLSSRLFTARHEKRTALIKAAISSVLVCGTLALFTRAASAAPTWAILLFWAGLALLFTLWAGLPWYRTQVHQVASLADALHTSRARVTRITSSRVVEFEEEEDEGACYAFAHGDAAAVFVVGQEFYEDDDFPNSDFSIVDLLGTHGLPVDTIIEKHGAKLPPDRVVPAEVKRLVLIPETLTIVDKPLDRVEDGLDRVR